MNTTTKPAAAPARNTLKVRTQVRAGTIVEDVAGSAIGALVRAPRPAGYAMAEMGL